MRTAGAAGLAPKPLTGVWFRAIQPQFWTTAFKSDPGVIGKQIRLSDRSATVVGVRVGRERRDRYR